MASASPTVSTTQIDLQCEVVPKINFACHQNYFPLLRDLHITNTSDTSLDNIIISLTANPQCITPKRWQIDRIAPEQTLLIDDRDIQLNGELLMGLNDSLKGSLDFQVVTAKGDILTQQSIPIELLAYNEWGGSDYMPELLAAFITPNAPSIDTLLKQASQLLSSSGKSGSMNGYQSNSRQRVWEIASAIYTAIVNLKLSYVVPPASFETNGQKIRLSGDIMDKGVGTCLDTALLFASALEQAGLNPVIALPEGHALVGVWLQPEEFSTITSDSPEFLRKRIDLDELILFETTCVTQHPAPAFSQAIQLGKSQISAELDTTFASFLDIKKARAHQIKPLGIITQTSSCTDDPTLPTSAPIYKQTLESAPTLPQVDAVNTSSDEDETPTGRLDRWQRRLLDLTKRNKLLNFRSTKTSIPLVCPDPGLLEDRLADGKKITILAAPAPIGSGQDETAHQRQKGSTISDEYAKHGLAKDTLYVNLSDDELAKRQVELYRKTKSDLEEGGSNTLYLALGFLRWKETIDAERAYLAPLILLPIGLERKSVRSGIKMVMHDDEPRFNTTLLEMLRKDYGLTLSGLDGDLPTDESGIDVAKIWGVVRQAVKDISGFEVTEDVVLSHFSFSKYLMWKDLMERTEELKNNPVVAHLLDNPKEPYPSTVDFIPPEELDQTYKQSDLMLALPADSSQISTVAAADKGKDFVIFGPPGTGKSQTIANLITHLLGKGKTVLFVSEKTAALEVVHRRLQDIGLGQFCLELHSNKAKKTEVLHQLNSAWQQANHQPASSWAEQAKELGELRNTLNQFVQHLHQRYPNGLTPYQAMGIKIRDEDLAQGIELSWPTPEHHSETQFKTLVDTVTRLKIQALEVAKQFDSPFQVIHQENWSPTWQDECSAQAQKLNKAIKALNECITRFCHSTQIPFKLSNLSQLETLSELAQLLLSSYQKQGAYALEANGQDRIESLEKAVTHLKAYAKAQAQLSCVYPPEAWRKIDGETLKQKWDLAVQSWWPKSFFAKRKVIHFLKDHGASEDPKPDNDWIIFKDLREEGEAIDALDNQLAQLSEWKKHDTNTQAIETLRDLTQQIRYVSGKLASDLDQLSGIRNALKQLINDGNELLADDAPIGRDAQCLIEAIDRFQQAENAFMSQAGGSIASGQSQGDNSLSELEEMTQYIVEHRQELREWCQWQRVRQEALLLELAPLVERLEAGSIFPEQLEDAFMAAYCTWWSKAVITKDDVLRAFSTPEHMATIETFKALDDAFQKTTVAHIHANLSAGIPDGKNVTRSSDWGILSREIQKKRQHKPIRKMMDEMPDVMTTLAPCLMMSPLSIAQYLPAHQALYDVVIFDEASQITVWDAVGALARGKQVIVAGDPKQMPPSNRFGRSDVDESDDLDDGDLESILDEMLVSGIPQQKLNWHYRSKQESLIAFSNHRYYGNSLVTFPAPTVDDQGVTLVHVKNGEYARGEGRHNIPEAKRIVAECVRRLTHKDDAVRQQSIGIVTFNTQQQTLIENLLDEERRKNPGIEWAFSKESALEPVFVKNLDTVQGDERDVILFSITFGPDKSGHITMNFGDLNRTGGERRLNVALTRARSEMMVFSSLSPEQIDLSRTSARAVADLKHFLEFAQRGAQALGSAVHGSIGDYDSPFEIAVANALQQKGWHVRPQIGVSAYRIDLGVVHPDKPAEYLAGIECDGATYHSSATAKDRDKIRQAVLERLGWRIYRIWSTDWWTNKNKAIEDIHEKLTKLLDTKRQEEPQTVSKDGHESESSTKNYTDSSQEVEENVQEPIEDHPSSYKADEDTTYNYSQEELQSAILSILNECPNNSCVKGELSQPKQSDIVAKVCQYFNIRPRSSTRLALAKEIHKSVKALANKGSIEEYQAKNSRIKLI